MSITDVCLKKPVFAWMIMAATITFGLVAATRIGISQFPDVDQPQVSIVIPWPGASPEDVETGVINVLEETLAQVEGVTSITSRSTLGQASIMCYFDISRDIDLALQDTQAKVSAATKQLPTDVQSPTISKSNPDDQPIIQVGLYGPYSRQLLADIARYLVQDKLETVPGVGQIQMNGYVDRAVRIWIDADKLGAAGLTIDDVTTALAKEHYQQPGGKLDTPGRQIGVRVLGEALNLDALRGILIKSVRGANVYLRDVGLVEDGFEDITSIARFNGQPVQAMGILKQRGSNAIAVAGAVNDALEGIRKSFKENYPQMELDVLFDTTVFIQDSVTEIEIELGLALVLTSLVCWLFLGSFSSTLNVVFAIPMSLLGTMAVIYFCSFTLNTFTLLGLSLAVGLVVDDAVMVMENIFRHAEMGKTKVQAASEGTKEITFAALAATLAVIAIFMPVVFMCGVVGKYFLQFGVTLSVAVGISYVEAITLAPARCAALLKTGHQHKNWLVRVVDRAFGALERCYGRALKSSLRVPWLVLIIGAASLAAGLYPILSGMIKGEFVPPQDQSRMSLSMQTAVGLDLDETDRQNKHMEDWLNNRPEVRWSCPRPAWARATSPSPSSTPRSASSPSSSSETWRRPR